MEVAAKLAVFVAGVVLAVVAGWAVGQVTTLLAPNLTVGHTVAVHGHS